MLSLTQSPAGSSSRRPPGRIPRPLLTPSTTGWPPMRVRLKGINSITKRLADGRLVTYWWAWKGGPPLRGEPGSPEFIASYNEAVARKVTPPVGVLFSILQGYQASEDFRGLADRTRRDYVAKIKLIERAFGDFPLSALSDRRTRGVFRAWRDELALSSRRQADYAWVVLARILSWALDGGLVPANPCERGGRLYRGSRADKIWTVQDEAAFPRAGGGVISTCRCCWRCGPASVRAISLRLPGQRTTAPTSACGSLRPSGIQEFGSNPGRRPAQGRARRSRQGEEEPFDRSSPTREGKPWTADGFRSSWRKACATAGVVGCDVQ